MNLSDDVLKYLDASVLCWLATVDKSGQPNVSPKEIFAVRNDKLLIANIASPGSVRNIEENPKVCVSFIDFLVQKGYQLKGHALVLQPSDFREVHSFIQIRAGDKYKVLSVISIEVEKVKPIIAPSYLFYPDTDESIKIDVLTKHLRGGTFDSDN